jgi:NAD(P)-dependent dehydrogenase (short-subunit alcohol dehydrogenase family)
MTERALDGRAALVTGGGSGIGAAIAVELARAGAAVCVAGRRTAALEGTVAAIRSAGGTAVAVTGDVADASDAATMVQAAADLAGGRLHVLVNNAAAPINGTIETVSLEAWQRALDVNLTGPMLTMRAALPAMRAAGGGAIVNVSSVAGLVGNPGITPYATSKAALIALGRQCAGDFGVDRIRVNTVCPGWVRTEMSELQMDALGERLGVDREGAFAAVTHHQPLRRVGEPHEVGRAVTFLASDAAAYITGTVVTIDGGSTAVGPVAELLGG